MSCNFSLDFLWPIFSRSSMLHPPNRRASKSRAGAMVLLVSAGLAASAQSNLGNVPVGANTSVTVTVTIASAGTPATLSVLTQGSPNLDFTNAGGGTCATGTAYAAGATCTVQVTFAPEYVGLRNGAIVLQDASGSGLSTTYLEGTGIGSQAGFFPSAPGASALMAGCGNGTAVDAAGDVFITCPKLSSAYKETPTPGGYVATQIAFGLATPDGLFEPEGIAVDGAGNVYIDDADQNRVVKETPTSSGYVQSDLPITGLVQPEGLAVDKAGILYIANWGGNSVVKVAVNSAGYQQTFLATGIEGPSGIAVDGNGNVFVSSPGSSNLYMFVNANGAYTQQILGSFQGPTYVATDGLGNVWVKDEAGGFYEETPVNGSYVQTVFIPGNPGTEVGDLADPFGFVVTGDFSFWQGGAQEKFGVPPSENFGYSTLGLAGTPTSIGVISLGNQNLQIAQIDFAPDFPESAPVSDPSIPSGFELTGECADGQVIAFNQACTLSIGFLPEENMNGQNDLDLAEQVTFTTNMQTASGSLEIIPVSGSEDAPPSTVLIAVSADPIVAGQSVTFNMQVPGTAVPATGAVSIYSTPATSPASTLVAVVNLDANGRASYTLGGLPVGTNNYYASYSGDGNYRAALSPSISLSVVAAPATSSFGNTALGAVNVGSSSSATPLTIQFTAAVTLGNVAVVTQGLPNLDFQNAGGGTCATGTAYTAGQSCTVNVVFKPLRPGPRYGAVVLTSTNGSAVGTGYLQGTGQGAQVEFSPGTLATIASPATYASGLAVDAGGNLYIAAGDVYKLTLANGQFTSTDIAPGIGAHSVALDGSGNIYVTGQLYGPSFALKLTPLNGAYAQTQIGYGFSFAAGVAVDGQGNVYVADSGGQVYKETLSNLAYTQSIVGGPWENPSAVAVDGSGNLYVTDLGEGINQAAYLGLFKETLVNGSYTKSAIGSNWKNPTGVAVDAIGNIYVADNANDGGSGFVARESLQPNGTYVSSTVASSLAAPLAVAVDGAGSVYISGDDGGGANYKLDVAAAPSLTFATTNKGATSSDSPKVVTLENGGNLPLGFLSMSFPSDFPEASGPTGECTPATALASGAGCTLTIDFTPTTAGTPGTSNPLSESVMVTINAAANPLNIAVTGTETIPSVPPSFTVNGTSLSVTPGQVNGDTANINIVPNGGFTGSVTLTAAVTSSPAGAVDLPTLSFGNTSPVNITSTNAVSATLTITTTAPSTSAMAHPVRSRGGWSAAAGAALACLVLVGIPVRRVPVRRVSGRRHGARSVLWMAALLLGSMAAMGACGGGSSGGGGGGQSIPGTTAGSYTVTVTATSGSTIATGTVALTVQ